MTEKTEDRYLVTDTILIDGFPGYQPGDKITAQVVKDRPDETAGKVKKLP